MTISSDLVRLGDLVAELVAIDSRNPWLIPGAPGETAIAARLAALAGAIPGVAVTLDPVTPDRPNVVASLAGADGAPVLCLNAHLDTVGAAGWPDRAFAPAIDGDRLVGLGSADDKGHCATIIVVLDHLARRPVERRPGIVATWVVDEEATSLGTETAVARQRADLALVLEPFGLGRTLVTHQGFGWIDLTVHGRAAHGSDPESGIDAISRLARLVGRLDALSAEFAARPDSLNGITVYHASTVSGGSDYATYPATARLGIEIGTQPGETIDDRLRDIDAIIEDLRSELPDFKVDVSVRLQREPFVAEGHETLLAAVSDATEAVLGRPATEVGQNAWMDAALVQAAGIPTLSIGASGGNLHAPDEWVSLGELGGLVEIVERTALALVRSR